MEFRKWVSDLVRDTPRFIAIDGRGGAGKSTLAARTADEIGAAVVHVDDVSWNFSCFDWADELQRQIVTPLRKGLTVDYKPPGWVSHNRAGSIRVPADVAVVIIEGTGIIRPDFRWEASIWIAGDMEAQLQRCIDRGEAPAFFDEWQKEEIPFLDQIEPWAHARYIVDGQDVTGATIGVAETSDI
ncbi:MAG: hypothetical protein SPK00_07080 [Corynebacterium glucuronolyticum]|nr:hypothetical protein [Mycobacteriaceae bacterium]MDY5834493.1 hypothetical protein [Corynebacterium glucuronolyticum]